MAHDRTGARSRAESRHTLHDIDRIISRAVPYAVVTGLLIGLYACLVLLAMQTLEPVHLSVWVRRRS